MTTAGVNASAALTGMLCLLAGKPLSKCGKCKRYMKYIAQRPSRLYCPSCEEVYSVPQVIIRLSNHTVCPRCSKYSFYPYSMPQVIMILQYHTVCLRFFILVSSKHTVCPR